MRKLVWLIGVFALAIICMMVASDDASATRQAQTLDLTVASVIENTTQNAEAQLTWIGGGLWDGVVSFEWFNTTGHEVFQEDITPDGVGYALSNYAPDWLGTWYVNASFTGTNPVYDNESFTVGAPSLHIINNGITNITWNDAVAVEAVFSGGQAYVGQDQGLKLVVTNSSSDAPIKGVNVAISVVTSEGETVVGYNVIGETNVYGELYHTFDIPVDPALENRFMEVEVNIHDVDYSDINGWLYNGRHAFFVGYFIEFTNDSAHPIIGDDFNVFDNVVCVMNYTMNYTADIIVETTYQFINETTGLPFYTNTVESIFTPATIRDRMVFPVPVNSVSGLARIQGFLRLHVPHTDETITLFRECGNFTINNTEPIVYNNLPYPICVASVRVGDTFSVEVNRTAFKTFDYGWTFQYLNNDTGQVFAVTEGAGQAVEGTVLYHRTFTVPRALASGNYSIDGQTIYTLDGHTNVIEFYSETFFVDAVVARASSTTDVFTNYTQLALDGTASHGYNDSYWGAQWTSTHAPNRTWYGLEPVMILNTTGDYMVTLNVTDGTGNYSELSFDVHAFVSPVEHMPNTRPIIIGYPETTVAVGIAYEVDFDFVDVDSPPQTIVFYLSTNATWLSLNSTTGVLSGTSQAGVYSVSITTIDDWGATDTYTYTLTVTSPSVVEETANETLQIVMAMGAVILILIVFVMASKAFNPGGKEEKP